MNRNGFALVKIFAVLLVLGIFISYIYKDTVPFKTEDVMEKMLAKQMTAMQKMTAASLPAASSAPVARTTAPAAPKSRLPQVKTVSIPQKVYDGIKDNPQYREYLEGNEKRVVLLTYPGCPYARAFRQKLDQLFSYGDYGDYYVKDIITTPQGIMVSCNARHMDCPIAWLFDNCGEGLCIINPLTRQAVVDASQNPDQIGTLLDEYKEW